MNWSLCAAWFRPQSFLVRLRALIIFQCLFVFAALGLILFYPLKDTPLDPDFTGLRQSLDLSARELIEDWKRHGDKGSLTMNRSFDGDQNVLSAVLYVRKGDSLVKCKEVRTDSASEVESHELPPDLSSAVDQELLRVLFREKPGFLLSTIFNHNTTLWYCRLGENLSEPVAMAALVNRDRVMSKRSDVMYAVFVLFLASLLLSLLMVNLVRRRFEQPLTRLIDGLDKTAAGELYSIVETSGDKELVSLSSSFNRMSARLWDGRQSLEASNRRLAKVNESLGDTERFLRTLIDSSPESVIVTSPEKRIVIFNREASRTFGYDRAEIVGKPITTLFSLTANLHRAPGEGTETAEREFEAIGVNRDQSSFPIFVMVRIVCRDNGVIWGNLYLVRDISESRSFQDMMIRLDRYYTRGEMAGDIAHEINNYLAVLSGNLELLPIILRKGDPEKLKHKLELMRGTVDKIAKFTDGLMDCNHDAIKFDPNDLNQVVQNVVAFLKPQNKFDLVRIETQLSIDLPLVEHDAGQIQQLLVNLINNAADAVAETEGERIVEIATVLTAREQGDWALIIVSDNGPGVAKEKESLLFEKRFTTKRRGHGIGLITCRRIAEAHQGGIRYEYHDGAQFTVELPVKQPERSGTDSRALQVQTSSST